MRASGRLRVRPLRTRDRDRALAYLDRAPLLNLVLIDLVLRLGRSRRGEGRPELLAAWRDGELAGVAALQPTLVLDALADREALEALVPSVASVGAGLVKSTPDVVDPLWAWLEARGRRALLDRIEIGYVLERGSPLPAPPAGFEARPARPADLDALVVAARASLLEEKRADPFQGDPNGFRRWVRSRLPRATVVTAGDRVAFVGYADVQSGRGWLLQGVYTWPEWRRRGLGREGVAALCRRAFEAGAAHVQLAVVEGNVAAERLYVSLGFRPFARLRTLLFS
ncbi:MAG: GNAT family N-acetyltransferase [Myxococcota bacterium]|nr:GNAT family N-acetyltransferase [Myxococcota bacterium]